jgi:hypothetical protein
MKPTQYDSAILQQFADGLYAQARWIIVTTGAKYGCVALVLSVIGAAALQRSNPQMMDTSVIGVIGTVTLMAIAAGVSAGRTKAFHLKLQAQQILCQRQIEVNTGTASVRDTKALAANA